MPVADKDARGAIGVKADLALRPRPTPGLDRMLKDATAGKFDVVMWWAIGRLGRSLPQLLPTMTELNTLGCGLSLHQQAVVSKLKKPATDRRSDRSY